MKYHFLTLFPEMIENAFHTSITGRAIENNILSISVMNIRDFSRDEKHHRVDDYTYGGGAGMLMMADPVFDACQAALKTIEPSHSRRIIYVTPQGRPFTQKIAEDLSKEDDLLFLCGHYEGIDERVLEETVTDYISIGDYVLTGGELPALVIADAVARLLPGVLHNEMSACTESFFADLLEYPQYSRPRIWHDKTVPDVLLSGNEKDIHAWQKQMAVKRTKERRMDLYNKYIVMQTVRDKLRESHLIHADMIELIDQGRALLLAADEKNILMEDTKSHLIFFTQVNRKQGVDMESGRQFVRALPSEIKKKCSIVSMHCRQLKVVFEEELDLTAEHEYYQAVYTLQNKLPIRGLYSLTAKDNNEIIKIRPLPQEYEERAAIQYGLSESEKDYISDRNQKGMVFGAFYDEHFAGFAGFHAEGSMGMLEVFPEFRRKHIGKALETYLVNLCLERGQRPFCQVAVENTASYQLQNDLGLCITKDTLFWMSR